MELLMQTIVVLLVSGLTLLSFRFLSGGNHKAVTSAVKEKKDVIIKIVVVIVVCVITLFLANNQIKKVGKNTYINNFEQFVVKVQENYKDYSEEDWTEIEEEYQELSEKQRQRYEKSLTKEDEKRISALEGEYLSYRSSGFIDNIIETTKDVFNNTIKKAEGFIKGLNNIIESDTVNE